MTNREIDALVAEKVMGMLTPVEPGIKYEFGMSLELDAAIPRYSTDIAAAWEVVEKLGLSVVQREGRWFAGRAEYKFFSEDGDEYNDGVGLPDKDCETWADTAPMAICLAALKACGVSSPAS